MQTSGSATDVCFGVREEKGSSLLLMTLVVIGNGLLIDIGHCCLTTGSEDAVNRAADLETTPDRHERQRPTTSLGVTPPSSRRCCRHPDLATDRGSVM